ncbi:MAG: hypothetical protein EOQ64_07285 [Mesorhizobium sp.]|uniref:hypothetical protein n=1 Tax=Mesorhizobium sp. TaxID=1871066 RepID=UPI000FE6B6B0|nr:hypothetical protein [Mesorhizobium sp.]RWG58666.1 MAG: hypothetical protein EOQ64_07285 [Mesorhizobium sp.]
MSIFMLIENAEPLADGIWSGSTPPHTLQMLGEPKTSKGTISVLGVEEPVFDANAKNVRFDAARTTVLNLGTSDRLLIVAQNSTGSADAAQQDNISFGPGDREFLRVARAELTGEAIKTAELLLRGVRAGSSGDLKRGKRLNFSNVPDNFWYVIVQPRVQGLSITVRGMPERFGGSKLELKIDRPGYTRFKVAKPGDVQEALRIIGLSKRRA